MFKFDYELLIYLTVIALFVDVFTVPFIQKTKGMFKKSKYIPVYAFFVNVLLGLALCYLFTDITVIYSLWVGLTSWIGADSIYSALESKLASHGDIVKRETVSVPVDNNIRGE